jgi:beta-aspartyl-peptidase (threonine type)
MKLTSTIAVLVLCSWSWGRPADKVVLVIHGGAGTPKEDGFPPALEKLCRSDLEQSLRIGYEILKKGGKSIDAVEATIKFLEDSPRFNAGRGAVFTRDGTNELDASIMEGAERRAGAVAGVSRIKNPISAARIVMDKTEHVLMVGAGAERLAFLHGLSEVSPRYFWTEHRWKELEREATRVDSAGGASLPRRQHFGTVGAVALDQSGHLAAGTSTGGMNYKRSGRLGDSPIISAGTYCDNRTCGVSCTGHGEVFIKHAVAFDVSARMRYKKLGVAEAVDQVFAELPKEDGGVGGLVALDREGRAVLKYNTRGMYRGSISADGVVSVMIYAK